MDLKTAIDSIDNFNPRTAATWIARADPVVKAIVGFDDKASKHIVLAMNRKFSNSDFLLLGIGVIDKWSALITAIKTTHCTTSMGFVASAERVALLREGPGSGGLLAWVEAIKVKWSQMYEDVPDGAVIMDIVGFLPEEGRRFFMVRGSKLTMWKDFIVLVSEYTALLQMETKSVALAEVENDEENEAFASLDQGNTCYNCGETGHWANKCPKKKQFKKRGRRGGWGGRGRGKSKYGKNNSAFYTGTEDDVRSIGAISGVSDINKESFHYPCPSWKSRKLADVYHSLTVNAGGKRIETPVLLDNIPATGVVDTGATVTLIRQGIIQGFSRQRPIYVKTANGTIQLNLSKTVKLTIQGKTFTHNIWLCPDLPVDILLGLDFLRGKAQVDMINFSVKFWDTQPNDKCTIEELVNKIDLQRHYTPVKLKALVKDVAKSGLTEDQSKLAMSIKDEFNRQVVLYWMHKFNTRDRNNGNKRSPSILPPHKIVLLDNTPIFDNRQTRLSMAESKFMKEKINTFLERGIISKEPINNPSQYNAPNVIAEKPQPAKDKFRFTTNFSRLNKQIASPRFPLPLIESVIQRCSGDIFSKWDIEDGYYNIALDESSRHLTAFSTDEGCFWYNVLPQGLKGAAEAFQSRISDLLAMSPSIKGSSSEAYVDDALLWSKGTEAHAVVNFMLLERMFWANIRPNWLKSVGNVATSELEWCGRRITANGVKPITHKAKALLDILPPSNYDEARSFFHMCSWHSQFVPRFGEVMWPIVKCIRAGHSRLPFKHNWDSKCQQAFNNIKRLIASAVELHRDGPGTYHIFSDASEHQVGGHLVRIHQGKKYIMGYYSHVLSPAESKYSPPKLELLGINLTCKHWRHLIVGRKLVIHTDAKSYAGLNLKNPTGVAARWLMEILDLCPEVVSIKGKDNVVADAMSRLRMAQIAEKEELPTDLRRQVFDEIHSGPLGGHFGLSSTIRELRKHYYWKGMQRDVANWYNACDFCQRYKNKGNFTKAPMTPIIAKEPWQIVGLDVVPFTLPSGSKTNFLAVVDYFSKKFRAISLKSTIAQHIVDKFTHEVEWVHGCPEIIISDAANNLIGDVFKTYCMQKGISHQHTTPYHQQANGQVEAMIGTFKNILVSKLVGLKMKWKVALKAAESAMNNYLNNSSTKFTPFEIANGYRYHSYIDNLMRLREATRHSAHENNVRAKAMQQFYYNRKTSTRKIAVDDWVLINNNAKKTVTDPLRLGPFQVVKVLGNDNYVIYNHNTGKYHKINISQIVRYTPREELGTTDSETMEKTDSNPPIQTPTHNKPTSPPTPPPITPTTLNTTNTNSPAKHVTPKPVEVSKTPVHSPTKLTDDLVGKRVSVYWKDYQRWYDGTIEAVAGEGDTGTHNIRYDDEHDKEPISEQLRGPGKVKWKYV